MCAGVGPARCSRATPSRRKRACFFVYVDTFASMRSYARCSLVRSAAGVAGSSRRWRMRARRSRSYASLSAAAVAASTEPAGRRRRRGGLGVAKGCGGEGGVPAGDGGCCCGRWSRRVPGILGGKSPLLRRRRRFLATKIRERSVGAACSPRSRRK